MHYRAILSFAVLVVLAFCAAGDERAVEWGPANNGLQARIEMERKGFKTDEAIPVVFIVRNVGTKPEMIWHSGFWANHRVYVTDNRGQPVRMTEEGWKRYHYFSPGGARNKNFPEKIEPGGESRSDGGVMDLTQLYDLKKPGLYTVQILYEEYQGGWQGKLWSNKLSFRVMAAGERGVDGEVVMLGR